MGHNRWRPAISSPTEATTRKQGLRGPVAAALVAAAFLVTMLGATLPTPLYPLYEAELGFGGVTVTLIFATYAVGVAAALIFTGRLSDQIGRRAVLLPGLVLAVVSSAVFLIPDSVTALFVGRVLSGLSAGIFTGTATAMLVDLAPEGKQARYSLLAACVNMLGLGLGPVVAGALAEYAPLPADLPYLVHIALVLVTAVGLWFVAEPVELPGGPVHWAPQRLGVPPEVRGVVHPGGHRGLRRVRRARALHRGVALVRRAGPAHRQPPGDRPRRVHAARGVDDRPGRLVAAGRAAGAARRVGGPRRRGPGGRAQHRAPRRSGC